MPSMAASPRSPIAIQILGGLDGCFAGLGAAWPLDSGGLGACRFWWGRFFTARSSLINRLEGDRAVTAGERPGASGGPGRPLLSRSDSRYGNLDGMQAESPRSVPWRRAPRVPSTGFRRQPEPPQPVACSFANVLSSSWLPARRWRRQTSRRTLSETRLCIARPQSRPENRASARPNKQAG